MNNQQIAMITSWWGNTLSMSSHPQNGTPLDAMKSLMGKVDHGIKSEDILRFEAALKRKLSALPQEELTIYNDYDLDDLLYEVASSIGMSTNCPPFPVKTGMWVTSSSISARLGYDGKTELLWVPGH